MKKITLSALFLASILTFSSCNSSSKKEDSAEMAEDTNEKKFDDTKIEGDAEFAVAAADGGMAEVQLGELAQKNAASQGVKDFGSMMVKDHSKANEEMKAMAAKKNITLPTTLSEKRQKMYNELAEKKGADFDKAYVSAMIDDHKADIELFEKEAKDGKDADTKALAAEKLPILNHHLETVQGLKEKLK